MKIKKLYCEECDRDTDHYVTRGVTKAHTDIFTRAFITIGTLGFSEVITDTYYECRCCGEETVS